MKKISLLLFVLSLSFSFLACKKEPVDNTPKDFPKPLVDTQTFSEDFFIVKKETSIEIQMDLKKDFKALGTVDAINLDYIKKLVLTKKSSYIKLTIPKDENEEELAKIKGIELKIRGNETVTHKLDPVGLTVDDSNEALEFLDAALQETLKNGKATIDVVINGKGVEDGTYKPTLNLVYDVKFFFGK